MGCGTNNCNVLILQVNSNRLSEDTRYLEGLTPDFKYKKMLSQTLITYIRSFKPNIDKSDIRMFLESSPQYPNLLSVIQTLQYAGLSAQAGQCDWDYLKNISVPFLLHLKYRNQENLVIAKWYSKLNALKCYNPKGNRWNVKGERELRNYWDGIVIYTNNKTTNIYKIGQKSIISSVMLAIIMFAMVCFCTLKNNVIYYAPILLGCVISGCLYFKSEMSGKLIDRLCHISKVTDCERVENSSYSSLFGFNMCCLAFSFFASQFIILGIAYIMGIVDVLNSLYFISTVVLFPVMAYSVYGQFKIKYICPLCIFVLLCVTTEGFIYICRYHLLPQNLNIIIIFGGIFLIASSSLQYIHNIKQNESVYLRNYIDLLKLKRKDTILQPESTPINTTQTPISFGEKDSVSVVTTLISPNCSHCREIVFEFLKLQKKGINFRWNIILGQTTPGDSEMIDNWILLYYTDKDQFFDDLYRWSNGTIVSMPISRSINAIDKDRISEIKHSFEREIADLNITGFPQIILNERLLSSIYTAKDIEFLISK